MEAMIEAGYPHPASSLRDAAWRRGDPGPHYARSSWGSWISAFASGAGLSFLVQNAAFAASFDCAQASSPRDRLICSDPALSDLDAQLGHSYQERKARLSAKGAEQLQSSERSWLHYIATVCPLLVPADGEKHDSRPNPKNCLKARYQERLGQLSYVGQKIDPFLLTRIDIFDAEAAPDTDTGATPGFFVQHVAYPQIDNPLTPRAEAWNKARVKVLGEKDGCDDNTDYEIGYFNQRMFSMQLSSSSYCHGNAHGIFAENVQNIVLPTLREMTQQDVFGPRHKWTATVQNLFLNAFIEKGWSPPANQVGTLVRDEIAADVTQPGRWAFSKDGLAITFSAYEGGCYACAPPRVTMPWADLKPLLSKDAVVP